MACRSRAPSQTTIRTGSRRPPLLVLVLALVLVLVLVLVRVLVLVLRPLVGF